MQYCIYDKVWIGPSISAKIITRSQNTHHALQHSLAILWLVHHMQNNLEQRVIKLNSMFQQTLHFLYKVQQNASKWL